MSELSGPRLAYVTVDCVDPNGLAAFWAAVLGTEVAGSWNQYVILVPQTERGVRMAFQQVPEPKQGKNRVHVDLYSSDLDGEVDRIVGLGGRRVEEHEQDGNRWWVLADPEDNEFCIMSVG